MTNICIMLDIDLVVVGSGSKYPFLASLVEDLQKEVDKKAILKFDVKHPPLQIPELSAPAVFAQVWLGDLFAG